MKRSSEEGFSLIEILAALAIIGLCLVGLLTLLPVASKTLQSTDARQTVVNMATAELEFIKNQTYIEYDSGGNPLSGTGYPLISPVPTEYAAYTPQINVGPTGENDGQRLQKITITIRQGSQVLGTLEGYKVKW